MAVHQSDGRALVLAPSTVPIAETSGQFQATGAATHYNDSVLDFHFLRILGVSYAESIDKEKMPSNDLS